MLTVDKLRAWPDRLKHSVATEDRFAPLVLMELARNLLSHLAIKPATVLVVAADKGTLDKSEGAEVANASGTTGRICGSHQIANRTITGHRKLNSHNMGLSTKRMVETGLTQKHECFSKNPVPITGPAFRAD